MRLKCITGDKSSIEYDIWSEWLYSAAMLANRHVRMWKDDDPFAYNETASVSFLAAAGSVAGHVALAECSTVKLQNGASAKAENRERHGRADLWLHTSEKNWAFEFKQRMNIGVSRGNGRLSSHLNAARKCAQDVIEGPDGVPVAGLIVSLYFVDDDFLAKEAASEIERFAKNSESNVDFCWRLRPSKGRRQTYFLFDLL